VRKYEFIAKRLEEEIKTLPPETLIPGERKLSVKYKVNVKTVNKAFRKLIEDNFLYQVRGKGRFTKSSLIYADGILGVIVPNFTDPVFIDYIRQIQKLLLTGYESHIEFMPFNVAASPSLEMSFLGKIQTLSRNLWIIKFPTFVAEEKKTRSILKKNRIKTLIMNDFWLSRDAFPSVRVDEERGVREAVEYLLKLGHKKIIYLDSKGEVRKKSLLSYKRTLKDHDIEPEQNLILFPASNDEEISEFMRRKKRPTALYTPYEIHAIKIIQILKRNGYSVPEDMSVVSGEDSELGQEFGLTVLQHPKQEMAAKALDILFGREKKKHFVFQPELIIRKTTDKPKQ